MESRSNIKKWIQEKVPKFIDWYLPYYSYFGTGQSHLAGIRHAFYIGIGSKVAFDWLPDWSVPIVGIAYLVGTIGFGKFWDKNKGYHKSHEWSIIRNPTLQYIKRKL